MSLRVGFLGVAHMHAGSYAHALRARTDVELVGVFDRTASTAEAFAKNHEIPLTQSEEQMLDSADALIIASENTHHSRLIEAGAHRGLPMLCEKPLVTSKEDAARVRQALSQSASTLMTAFPCRFSPAFHRLKSRVQGGDIGEVLAVCATNRGRCPFGWFVDRTLSGGGAIIDHVVHVADLLAVLLGEAPRQVACSSGNNMHSESWEDCAMVTLDYPSGIFATLDSSWSRAKSYKTWGDVTLNVVGSNGVMEIDLFSQAFDLYRNSGSPSHAVAGFGSDLDAQLIHEFVTAARERRQPTPDAEAGISASMVAVSAAESARDGAPVFLTA